MSLAESRLVDYLLSSCCCGHGEYCERCDPNSGFRKVKEVLLGTEPYKTIAHKKLLRKGYKTSTVSKWFMRRLCHEYTKSIYEKAGQINSKLLKPQEK